MAKKDKIGIMIAVGKLKDNKKTKMAYGGMANGKKHMYLSEGSFVKDNPGLKALKSSGPKGLKAYNTITGKTG